MEILVLLPILIPLAAALINMLFGRVLGEKGSGWLGTLACVAAFGISVVLFLNVNALKSHTIDLNLGTWIGVGKLNVPFGFLIDPLSSVLMLIITGVGALIHIYSISYMHGDARFPRYFVYLNLFVAAMLLLVTASNYLLMFVGWEGVGLCSYLLISFWYEKSKNVEAARKAFIVNRIGDVAFALALMFMFVWVGSFNFKDVFAAVGAKSASLFAAGGASLPAEVLAVICILLLIGAAGKSAQLPLFVWLPDAMAGPTPASALIHAATMVTAGVYMIVRSNALFHASELGSNAVALVGAATALVAGSIAVRQYDIKKVLAYSTVSQLGFMVAAAGLGAYVASIFHLLTHAFFKALLFLAAGSIIHGMEHYRHHMDVHGKSTVDPQDMRNMGGLWKRMPWTALTFLAGALSLAGIPPFSGFWSKDEIVLAALEGGTAVTWLVWAMLTVTAGITAFYTGRQLMLVFWGEPRTKDARHAHEADWLMRLPLIVLALLATIGGLLNLPQLFGGDVWLEHWLEPSVGKHEGGFNIVVAAGYTILALAALGAAFGLYRYGGRETSFKPQTGLKAALNQGWWIDAFYNNFIVKGFMAVASALAGGFDPGAVDGTVNGIGRLIAGAANALRPIQTGYVRNYALMMLLGVVAVLAWFVFGTR